MTKIKIWELRNKIVQNIDYLSTKYQKTNDILYDLNRIISLDMSHSLMFQWWCENEESIDTINNLLQMLEE